MTSFLAAHGLWAVFVLMAIDAVFPAASELVMLYAGALASGALSDQLVVFGTERSGPDAYLAVALAGTIGYLFGAIVGWAIGLYGGKPFLERRGRWFHLGPDAAGSEPSAGSSAGTTGRSSSAGSRRSHGRSSRSPPACSRRRSSATRC